MKFLLILSFVSTLLLSSSECNKKKTNTGKNYTDVFGLAEACKFPNSINEGEEFNFIVDTIESEPCIVCNAYYPTPSRKLKIKVVDN